MSIRHVARTVALSAAVISAGTCSAMAFTGTAGASTLVSGPVTLTTTGGSVAAGTPYSSGQVINISVAANTTMDQASLETAGFPDGATPIKALECSDPGGLPGNLPSSPLDCDGNTILSISGANADGSLTINNYSVYALPDVATFGESPDGTPVCGVAPNDCVIGIFSNQNDFADPVVFSAPFQVTANGDDGGENPGDGTPEVPLAIGLPIAAAGIIGGSVYVGRRRRRAA